MYFENSNIKSNPTFSLNNQTPKNTPPIDDFDITDVTMAYFELNHEHKSSKS